MAQSPPNDPRPVPARDAATIMLVRDGAGPDGPALEVCMLRRHADSQFFGGVYVFPGGKVDEDDRSSAAGHACAGRGDDEASAMLGLGSGGLAFWVAALRECFEEAGVLLAYDAGRPGRLAFDGADPERLRRLADLRLALNAGEVGFLELLHSESLSLAVDRVHYFSHWVTPEPAPKRYDTRFFVAALPAGQVPVHDEHETVDTVWVRPHEALRRAAEGEFEVIFPTMKNLEAIGRFTTGADLLEAAAAVERVPTVVPRVVADHRGFRILLPGDPGYEEAIATVDGTAARDMTAAEVGEAIRSVGSDGRSRPR